RTSAPVPTRRSSDLRFRNWASIYWFSGTPSSRRTSGKPGRLTRRGSKSELFHQLSDCENRTYYPAGQPAENTDGQEKRFRVKARSEEHTSELQSREN